MPWVHPRRNATDGVFVANTNTSISGRLDAIISVALAKRVRRLRPASLSAAPTSVWQTLSIRRRHSAVIAALGEDVRFEEQNASAGSPRIARQSGLDARMFEKGLAIPR